MSDLATHPAPELRLPASALPRDRLSAAALVFAAGIIVACVSVRTISSWINYGDLEHTSGTWMAMAADARDGVLYRPIATEQGLGGSRYAPLHAIVQAGLLRVGLGVVASGYAIGLVALISLLLTAWLLMRQLGATKPSAVCFTSLILAASGVSGSIAANRADLLAAALNLWGLLAVVVGLRSKRLIAIPAAAVLFALALSCKITSVFGLSAAVLALLIQRRRGAAVALAATWAVAVATIVLAVQWASDGRAFQVFATCAAGGGTLRGLIRGPLMFLGNMLVYDKGTADLFSIAVVGLLMTDRRQWCTLPALFLIISAIGTMGIFGTPGINVNHLVDLQVAAAIFLAVQWHHLKARPVFAIFLAVVMSIQAWQFLQQAQHMWNDPPRRQMAAALADADASGISGPMLSENPLLPLMDGQRPYLLDSFMFRVINGSRPELTRQFWDDLAKGRFRAVVLSHSPTWKRTYTEWNFGPGFIERLNESYELKAGHGDYYVYWPKKRGS